MASFAKYTMSLSFGGVLSFDKTVSASWKFIKDTYCGF